MTLWRAIRDRTALASVLLLVAFSSAAAEADDAASDPHVNDRFGASALAVGDELLIGAPGDNGAAFNGGAVYVFEEDDGTLLAADKLFAAKRGGHEWFGLTMATDGSRVIVSGAEPWILSSSVVVPSKRAAWILRRDDGVWVEEARLIHDDDAVLSDSFGAAVAIAGDHAAVLADRVQIGQVNVGARVDVFDRGADGWQRSARLTGLGNPIDVVLVGDHLLVAGTSLSGGLYGYAASGGAWEPEATPMTDLVKDLAVLGDEPPRVAAVHSDQVTVLRHDGAWAVEAILDLPDSAIYSAQSIAGVDDQLVALCRAEGESVGSEAVQAVTYRSESGAWRSIGEPITFDFSGASRAAVAVTHDRLAIGFRDYPTAYDMDASHGMVAVYNAADDGWSPAQELVPGPIASGCRVAARGTSSSGLLLGLFAFARRRRA